MREKRAIVPASPGGQRSLRGWLFAGMLGVGGLKLASLALTFLLSIVLARGLGPEGYGRYSFVMAVLALLSLPVAKALKHIVTREIARSAHGENGSYARAFLSLANRWVLICSTVIVPGAITVVLMWNKGMERETRALMVVGCLLVPVLGWTTVRSSTLRGFHRIVASQVPELLVRPAFHLAIVSTLLLYGTLSPMSAMSGNLAAAVFSLLVAAWLMRGIGLADSVGKTSTIGKRQWAQSLAPFMALAFISTMGSQIGILCVGIWTTDSDVAALQVAQRGAMLVLLPLTIVNLVIGPRITRAYERADRRELQRLSRRSARLATLLALPVSALLVLFPGGVVSLVYGEAYGQQAALPLALLSGANLFSVASGSVALLLTMSDFELDAVAGRFGGLMASGLVAWLAVPAYGATGGAMAAAAGVVVWNSALAFGVWRRLGVRPSLL